MDALLLHRIVGVYKWQTNRRPQLRILNLVAALTVLPKTHRGRLIERGLLVDLLRLVVYENLADIYSVLKRCVVRRYVKAGLEHLSACLDNCWLRRNAQHINDILDFLLPELDISHAMPRGQVVTTLLHIRLGL